MFKFFHVQTLQLEFQQKAKPKKSLGYLVSSQKVADLTKSCTILARHTCPFSTVELRLIFCTAYKQELVYFRKHLLKIAFPSMLNNL